MKRKGVALVVAMTLAATSQLGGAARVVAAETSPVSGGSWYFEPQLAPVDTPAGPVAPPALLPTPDVPKGDFATTAILGIPNKESYIHVDPTVVVPGATVEKLTLTLKESASGLNLLASSARISAYPVVGFWSDGSEAAAWATRPDFDATVAGPGTRAADGTWTFDLTAIAKRWAEGLANNGVALIATELVAPETWQVVWSGASPRPFTEGIVRLPPIDPTIEPDAPAGDIASEAVPATSAADVVVPSPAPSLTVTPAGGATPVADKRSSRDTAFLRRVQPLVAEGEPKRAPPWPFYLAVAVLVAVLLLGGIALGERGEPLPERRGSVLRTLERRTPTES